MRNHRLLLPLLLLSLIAAVSAVGRGALVGGYSPVKDPNDEHILDVAKFAVDQYNTQNGQHLQFVKVLKAESQVVAGTNYRLVIAAKDGAGALKNYQAIVYERPWQKVRQLTSFKPL